MPSKTVYGGKYKIKKPEKYIGDTDDVNYRSLWEKAAFRWCERNPRVKKWGSEVVKLDYLCGTDKRVHKYFVDLFIEWSDGSKSIVEIKPEREQKPPVKRKRQTKKYIQEAMAYVRNESKWRVASAWAKKMGYKWEIWGESALKSKGIKVL